MNTGPNRPTGGHGGRGRRRRRGRRGAGAQGGPGAHGAQAGPGAHQGRQQHGSGAQQRGPRPPRPPRPARAPKHPDAEIYSAPMDHSYRAVQNGDQNSGRSNGRGPRPGFGGKHFMQPEPEPIPMTETSSTPRIFAFIEDLFFVAKINETARKLNLKVQFVKSDKDIFDAMEQNGNEPPTLVIVDLNNLAIKPLPVITKLKSKFKKETNVIGFLSHVQGDLKLKAQEAGCDMVLPRSAFSANLPQLLRRHAVSEDTDEAQ